MNPTLYAARLELLTFDERELIEDALEYQFGSAIVGRGYSLFDRPRQPFH